MKPIRHGHFMCLKMARDAVAAKFAAAFRSDVQPAHLVPPSLRDGALAAGAEGVRALGIDVAFVHEL